jgi:hypothetical protein
MHVKCPQRSADNRPWITLPQPGALASRTMSWTWRLEDPAGAAIEPASLGVDLPESDNQGDAESWLGENWRELLARGVATVTLFEGDQEVYGPMGLAAT